MLTHVQDFQGPILSSWSCEETVRWFRLSFPFETLLFTKTVTGAVLEALEPHTRPQGVDLLNYKQKTHTEEK